MRIPGRRWAGPLRVASATPPEGSVDRITVLIPGLYVFPKSAGLYPLREFSQLELYWGLWQMPGGGAAFVDLTMVSFRGFLNAPSPATFDLGSINAGLAHFEIFQSTFEQLDTTNGRLNPFQARIRKTAADSPGNDITFNGNTYQRGTRHSFPICDDYIGFLIQSDGLTATGNMTLWATLGSTGSGDAAG